MEFVKPVSEKLAELDKILEGWVHRRRAAISDGRDPERVNREIANINQYIDRCTKQVAELIHRRDNWRDLLDEADKRIAELRLEIDGLRWVATPVVNASPEDQLLEIAKLAAQLGLSQEDLEAAMLAASGVVQ